MNIFGNTKVESKSSFYKTIKEYYVKRNGNKYSETAIDDLSKYLSNFLFDQYKGFRKDYPELKKKYSNLQIEDLEGAFIQDMVIYFLRDNYNDIYSGLCSQIFNMSKDEFFAYERKRDSFENL